MGSLKLGKFFRMNASRSGISVSGGVKGMRLSVGSKGIRTHVTVPGTGYTKTNTLFSFRKLWKKNKKKAKTKSSKKSEQLNTTNQGIKPTLAEEGGHQAYIQDELVLVIDRRRPFGSFTDKAKGDRAVNKAAQAYNNKDYEGAATYLNEAYEHNPADAEAILFLAVISYMYLEDYSKAAEFFEKLGEDSFNEDMLLAYSDCLFELKDYDASMDLLESFEFNDDEDMERITLLARNHMAIGQDLVAEELLKSIIGRKRKMTPYLIEAKYWIGTLYLKKGNFELAKKHLMAVYLEDNTYEEIGEKIEELALSGDEAEY